jgi:hypothetical protein
MKDLDYYFENFIHEWETQRRVDMVRYELYEDNTGTFVTGATVPAQTDHRPQDATYIRRYRGKCTGLPAVWQCRYDGERRALDVIALCTHCVSTIYHMCQHKRRLE